MHIKTAFIDLFDHSETSCKPVLVASVLHDKSLVDYGIKMLCVLGLIGSSLTSTEADKSPEAKAQRIFSGLCW